MTGSWKNSKKTVSRYRYSSIMPKVVCNMRGHHDECANCGASAPHDHRSCEPCTFVRQAKCVECYTVFIDDPEFYILNHTLITKEGAKIIYGQLAKHFSFYSEMDDMQERLGGIAYYSQIRYLISNGFLPKDFNLATHEI